MVDRLHLPACGSIREDADGSVIESCTILTTTPNTVVEPLHSRMPVIVAPEDYDEWLGAGRDATASEQSSLRHLLRPYEAEEMKAYAVSKYVSSPFSQGARCIEPMV